MGRIMRNVVLAASLGLALAACGRKGMLTPEAPADIPRDVHGKPVPNRPFILDPLIR